MSYTVTADKHFAYPADKVIAAVKAAAEGLEGEVIRQEEQRIHIKFKKTIHGQVLGDRTVIEVKIQAGEDTTTLDATVYPINPVGDKLMFGVRKGVPQKVLGWFWAHVNHNLEKSEG